MGMGHWALGMGHWALARAGLRRTWGFYSIVGLFSYKGIANCDREYLNYLRTPSSVFKRCDVWGLLPMPMPYALCAPHVTDTKAISSRFEPVFEGRS